MTKANERAAQTGYFCSLYGPGGAGKTTLACGAADYEDGSPAILFSADSGASAIENRSNIEVVDVTKFSQIEKVTELFQRGGHGFKTVVHDNLTEYQKLSLAAQGGPGVARGTDIVEIQEYLKSTNQMEHTIKTWRDMTRFQNLNVIFVLWDVEERDDTGKFKKMVQFTPALQKSFPGLVDSVGWVGPVDGHPELRVLDFTPSTKTHAKFRRAPTSAAMKVPYQIFYPVDKLPMADIIRTVKGGSDWPTSKYPTPQSSRG